MLWLWALTLLRISLNLWKQEQSQYIFHVLWNTLKLSFYCQHLWKHEVPLSRALQQLHCPLRQKRHLLTQLCLIFSAKGQKMPSHVLDFSKQPDYSISAYHQRKHLRKRPKKRKKVWFLLSPYPVLNPLWTEIFQICGTSQGL